MIDFHSWRRIMVFDGYVDDSGSDTTGINFVLGGVVMPSGWWKNWEEEWSGALNAHPKSEYFKASEVWERDTRKGTPFCLLTDEERRSKVDALAEILIHYRPKLLSIHMSWNTFNRFGKHYALTADKSNPYFWLYYGIITLGIRQVHGEASPTPIDWIFDNQNAIGDRAKEYYAIFKSMCTPEVLASLGREPEFADEKTVLPLQAADMLAWYRRRDSLKSIYGEWHQRIWDVMGPLHISAIMEDDHLAYIATTFGVMIKA
jgi:hypothetical protein